MNDLIKKVLDWAGFRALGAWLACQIGVYIQRCNEQINMRYVGSSDNVWEILAAFSTPNQVVDGSDNVYQFVEYDGTSGLYRWQKLSDASLWTTTARVPAVGDSLTPVGGGTAVTIASLNYPSAAVVHQLWPGDAEATNHEVYAVVCYLGGEEV